jgi:hypothetical protein
MSSIPDHGRAFTLVDQLVADAARDLNTWAERGPNYLAAGRAALVAIEAVIASLERVRGELVPALLLDNPQHRARLADLPDPAGIIAGNSGAWSASRAQISGSLAPARSDMSTVSAWSYPSSRYRGATGVCVRRYRCTATTICPPGYVVSCSSATTSPYLPLKPPLPCGADSPVAVVCLLGPVRCGRQRLEWVVAFADVGRPDQPDAGDLVGCQLAQRGQQVDRVDRHGQRSLSFLGR